MADAIYEDVYTPLGYVKGSKGDKGDTGDTGVRGAAATISVGSVSTTQYGNPAVVTNSGTANDAVLDFVIPQGQPGEEVTDLSGLTLGTMTTQAAEYPVPQVGDNGATLFGKIAKHFTDLRALINTKLNIANVVNNKTTNQSGYALDARQANPDVSGTLAADVKALNDNLEATESLTFTSKWKGLSVIVEHTLMSKRIRIVGATTEDIGNASSLVTYKIGTLSSPYKAVYPMDKQFLAGTINGTPYGFRLYLTVDASEGYSANSIYLISTQNVVIPTGTIIKIDEAYI